MTTPEDVIFRVIQEAHSRCRKGVYRTALVKLVYLVDYVYAQHTGKTVTGFDYAWDDHGPNAVGNAIVKRADSLKLFPFESIDIETGVTPSGNPKFLYRVRDAGETKKLPDELAERIISDVVGKYARLNWAEIVAAAKQTQPVLRAKQGDRLDLAADPRTARQIEAIGTRLSEKRYDRKRPGVSLSQLKERYGFAE